MLIPILFDLDGVIADNVEFEEEVTKRIIEVLSQIRNISLLESLSLWNETLEKHRYHYRWHDYGLHCRALSLDDIWKEAHISSQSLLRKCTHIDRAISVAREMGPCWIVSDATDWVVEFKLKVLGLEADFSEIFTVDRCGNHKSSDEYWAIVEKSLPTKQCPVILIENRYDCIIASCNILKNCAAIFVKWPDHPTKIGFKRREEIYPAFPILRSSHAILDKSIQKLGRKLEKRVDNK
jgi:FMN phosphatase YigB (HAD superfamily)